MSRALAKSVISVNCLIILQGKPGKHLRLNTQIKEAYRVARKVVHFSTHHIFGTIKRK